MTCILLVEDESLVRELIVEVLRDGVSRPSRQRPNLRLIVTTSTFQLVSTALT
jgi:CheY-like chemotaxis protein